MTDGRTHWDECWRERGHQECAVAMVERLRQRVAELERENEHFEPRIDEAMAIASQPSSADVERRPCTCHPDDNPPVPCPRMYALQDCRRAAALAAEVELLRKRLAEARCVCDEQATDAGLWFVAEMVTEAYLQAALRRLHAAVEGTADSASNREDERV